jgi:hypothetical protein
MFGRGIALVAGKAVLRMQCIQRDQLGILAVLARMEAAEMACTLASPLTMASAGR